MTTQTEQPVAAVPATYHAWLTEQVRQWQAESLIDQHQATAILGRYREQRRFNLVRLLTTLGAGFVGVGAIWLVAANLDQLSPLLRFGVVAGFWLASTVGAELLAARRSGGAGIPTPVVGAARIIATALFGAVIFQAAQSLQVPAYEPALVGLWGLGALVQAYAVRAIGPLVVGVVGVSGWLIWQVGWDEPSALGVVLAMLCAGVISVAAAALHTSVRGLDWPGFGAAWREIGAAWLLAGLFAAALPSVTVADFSWTPVLMGATLVALVLTAVAVAMSRGRPRLEPAGALTVGGAAVLLVLWEAGSDPEIVGVLDWLHAVVSVGVYVAAAAGVAVLGVLRSSPRLTALATASLVLFTTVQSFAVFAEIIDGAWLFLLLGAVLLATGLLADRGRRELAQTLEGAA